MMEELILDYINSYCEVTSKTSVSFNGNKIYHTELTKHLIDLFDIEWSVDDILMDCFEEKSSDFNYISFMDDIKLEMPIGQIFYMDYVYRGAEIPPNDYNVHAQIAEMVGIPRRYFGGIDTAMGDDATVNVFCELDHPDSSDDRIYAMSRVAEQLINFDLTPISRDLEE